MTDDYDERSESLRTDAERDYAARVDEFSRVLSAPDNTDKSDTTERTAEDRAWIAANAVAWVGASNTAGVALSLHEMIVSLRASGMPWSEVDRHPAVRAMVGHLAFLTGQGLGPELDDLTTVHEHGARLLDS